MVKIQDPSLGAWHIEEGMNNKVTVVETETSKLVRSCKDLNEAFLHISNLRFFNETTEPLSLHTYILTRDKIAGEIRAAQQGISLQQFLMQEEIKKGIENGQSEVVSNPVMQTQE